MKRSKIIFVASIGFALNILFINAGQVPTDQERAKGLRPLTDEEIVKLRKNQIKSVSPNQKALERVNAERKRKNLPELKVDKKLEEKIEYLDSTEGSSGGSASESSATTSGSTTQSTSGALMAIPEQVDNSTLPSFPKVGNQGNQGSCVAWAITYYQMSHQVCQSLGCDNKNLNQRVFSPRWTYNMINGGVDGGSYFSDAYSLMAMHGAAELIDLPYTASDFRGWDLNPDNWKEAAGFRMSNSSYTQLMTETDFTNVKQLLANGNVIVIGTYISSWQYSTIKNQPGQTSPFAGQSIAYYLNGTAGAHAMTLVGFDDSIWTDINANGVVDTGETGAFKIANSWGTGWGHGGFMWAAYDAFRPTSLVSGFAPSTRRPLTQGYGTYLITYTNSSPKLLAQVTVSHGVRNQMSLQFAASSTSSLTPQRYFYPFALANKGGVYAFNGSTTEVEGTFYFDISSLVSSTTPIDQQLYHLTAFDSVTGAPLTVRSFNVIDPVSGTAIFSAANVPLVTDGASSRLIAGNYTPDTQAPTAPGSLTAQLVSQKKGKRVTVSIRLSWQASIDNDSVQKYLIFRDGVKISETTSLSFSDTSTSAGRTYNYQVFAVDPSGNQSQGSNIATVVR